MSEEKINKDRNPTPADLIILRYLESGQSINNVECIQKFKNAMLRDAIWRLKKAGYPITAQWVKYETKEGKPKKYKSYFITTPEIIAAGQTIERVPKGDGIADFSRKMQKVAITQSLFPEE